VVLFFSCSQKPVPSSKQIETTSNWSENPWPEIRIKRINQLLPEAMKVAGVDAWLVICRENDNDPLADHVGGENAGGTAAFLFYLDKQGFHSLVFSPEGEAKALDELDIHDEVRYVKRGVSTISEAASFIQSKSFSKIAINSSETNYLADGLSYTQRQEFEKSLGKYAKRLVSSDELIYEWMSVKLPEEVEIMAKAAQLTADWQVEAYQQVIPGKTTDADVARFLKRKIAEHGVEDGWAADQNPNVNSGPDRGHSHATNKVIQPGDVIQTDFGIKVYGRWVTDIQRFAYVLKEGETKAPEAIQNYWNVGKQGSRIALEAMKPGVRGIDVDKAQRDWMEKNGSLFVPWSTGHPVGYVAHDSGPNLGGAQAKTPRVASLRTLKEGMTFAFDGFYCWKQADGTEKTISVEEMAVVTKEGARYLIPPQEELVLIKSK